jgi:hypothetical protein
MRPPSVVRIERLSTIGVAMLPGLHGAVKATLVAEFPFLEDARWLGHCQC